MNDELSNSLPHKDLNKNRPRKSRAITREFRGKTGEIGGKRGENGGFSGKIGAKKEKKRRKKKKNCINVLIGKAHYLGGKTA